MTNEVEVSGESGTARELGDPPEGRVTRLVELFDAVGSAIKSKGASRKVPPSEEDGQE